MATSETVTAEELGGAKVHGTVTGLADHTALDEFDAIQKAREWVATLNPLGPSHQGGMVEEPLPPRYPVEDVLSIVNTDIRKPFDMREVLLRIVDDSRLSIFKPGYGVNMLTAWADVLGFRVGLVANQTPVIHPQEALKAAQFIRLCNQEIIPIIFLHNVTGFMVGTKAEHAGIIKAGAQLVSAVSCSSVPHISIILGASYGAGNYAMCGRSYRPRFLFTWPTGRCSVMGPDQLAGVMETIKSKSNGGSKLSTEQIKAQAQKTVAVYTQEDALSQHVADAHESICIGSIEHDTKNPFLNIDLLLKTALEAHADAVHPGYGYLSENADFADRVRATGLTFVGPTGQTISTLGDKRTSKEYLRTHAPEVPLIPGFSGSSQNVEDLQDAATRIGFPVMLKASAGGGGKGMRVVREASQLQSELDRAQSEAQRSFGSSDCILEKFIESSKHVEIQIVGDQHGNVVSLFERDCSVQRRNQKVIEETPCLFLDEQTKKSMSDTAVKIGKLLGYEGAGTVEFVVDTTTKKFYFLEVNTRLQVEHPITEEVVGVDLVSLQLYVAAGGRLADVPELSALTQTGHAIECRLCAEVPNRDFMPSHDTVALWKPANPHRGASSVVRYETAMQSGASISIYFDSMICKIVVWAPTRALAIDILAKELANTACVGIKTNQLFLQSCLLHPGFKDTAYQTSFIPTHLDELLRNPYLPELPRYTSAIPGLLFDALKKASRTQGVRRQPFGGVRRGFHNQNVRFIAHLGQS
ncbi:Methylcrotonoyl-CoA carboxylase subunit alpha [Colletotrichum fructicola]|nr:Methylcrotonoyl-CoA carboxylase subunit alpha [Colletotrichum fructicola]